jgi:hypothetical protein
VANRDELPEGVLRCGSKAVIIIGGMRRNARTAYCTNNVAVIELGAVVAYANSYSNRKYHEARRRGCRIDGFEAGQGRGGPLHNHRFCPVLSGAKPGSVTEAARRERRR